MLFHRSDPRPDALADAEWALIGYEREFEEIPPKAKDAKYLAALESFMRAYRDRSEVVALAYHARAELYRDAGERGRLPVERGLAVEHPGDHVDGAVHPHGLAVHAADERAHAAA